MPRRGGPGHTRRLGELDASTPPGARPSGVKASVVADGDEIPDCGLADVGAALDDLFSGRPILVADLAGAEDVAAAPTTLDLVRALREQLGVFRPLCVDAGHLVGIGGEITAATSLGVTQHCEERAGNVDAADAARVGLFERLRPGRRAAIGKHAGQGRLLAELDGVDVFEVVEVGDHAALAFRDLFGSEAVPIARARHALDVDRLQAASLFQPRQVVGRVAVVDHVLDDAAAAKVLAGRLYLDEMRQGVRVDDLALLVLDLVHLIEEADVAGGFEKTPSLLRDVGE